MPGDFMFRLTRDEARVLRYQFGTSDDPAEELEVVHVNTFEAPWALADRHPPFTGS